MNHLRTTAIISVNLVVLAAVAWQFVDRARTSLELTFADEQTSIFAEMVDRASAALNHAPPDLKAAVGYLGYVHSYYPSGTKQTSGSRLDRIVERSRSCAESRIMEMLRLATGEDLGTSPDAWMSRYGDSVIYEKQDE